MMWWLLGVVWLLAAGLYVWASGRWRDHVTRIDAYQRHPATRARVRLLTDPRPVCACDRRDERPDWQHSRRRCIPPCRCGGLLHDTSGVWHSRDLCTPLREVIR